MECTLESSLSATPLEPTTKQQNLLNEFALLISQEGIEIEYNRKDTSIFERKAVAVDVEHDESGGFVGCGISLGGYIVYYFNDLAALMRVPFYSLAIIAHNGVSDIECLQTWGMNVSYKQLTWDTMLLGHIIDSSLKSYSLKDMAKRELGITYPSYDDIVGKRGLKAERTTLDKQPMELVAAYNSMDVYCTWKLYERQKKALGL